MKRLLFFLFLLLGTPAAARADHLLNDTTRAVFSNDQIGLTIHLDLGKESLTIPGMSYLGPVNGYMDGNIYGVWMLIKHEVKDGKALLRFTNDIGADSQDITLTPLPDGTYKYQAVGGNNIRRVQGRKLVKITDIMVMKRGVLRR